MSHRVFIVEDHPLMRQAYATLIGQERDLEVCGDTGSARDALQVIPELQPDLAIVDLTLKEGSGLELIKDLQAPCPDLPILAVSMHDEALYADRVLLAGARGYLMKNKADTEVIKAIRQVLDGGVYLSPESRTRILSRFVSSQQAEAASPLDRLDDRELEVFEYIGRGFTTQQIAEALQTRPPAIDRYRTRIKDKLSLDSNAKLERWAILWVETEDDFQR